MISMVPYYPMKLLLKKEVCSQASVRGHLSEVRRVSFFDICFADFLELWR